MRRILSLLMIIVLTIGVLIGCAGGGDSSQNNEPVDNDETTEIAEETDAAEEADTGSFPLEVTDALDNEVTIENEPERIVSLIPSNTEIVFALDLGEKVVGVTENDTYRSEEHTSELQ